MRLSRPLPGVFLSELHDQLAYRHVELRVLGNAAPLREPTLGLDELRRASAHPPANGATPQ